MAISGAIGSILQPGVSNLYSQAQQAYPNQMQGVQLGAYQNSIQAQPIEISDDPSDWSEHEQLKMFIWFMKMYHEEDIKGFKALRDIERSVERSEREGQERQRLEAQMWLYQQQIAAQQTAYANATSVTTSTATGTCGATNAVSPYGRVSAAEEPEKESWWKKLLK